MNVGKIFDISGKVVMITGSSRGLGFVFARGFAESGATVAVNGTHPDTVQQAVEEIRQRGGRVAGFPFDVTDAEQVARSVTQIEAELGPIDVLINNAGIHRRAPLEAMTMEEWQAVIDVNLSAVFMVTQGVVKGMIARKRGKIINISSLNAEASRPNIGNYCASKGGLDALTRSMATEWGRYNIQANAIGPGYFVTDLTRSLVADPDFDAFVKRSVPLERWGDPAELIGPAIFLASDASNYITGRTLYVDGGWRASL
jgi:gluconate 5-dehydrogenase